MRSTTSSKKLHHLKRSVTGFSCRFLQRGHGMTSCVQNYVELTSAACRCESEKKGGSIGNSFAWLVRSSGFVSVRRGNVRIEVYFQNQKPDQRSYLQHSQFEKKNAIQGTLNSKGNGPCSSLRWIQLARCSKGGRFNAERCAPGDCRTNSCTCHSDRACRLSCALSVSRLSVSTTPFVLS
jgi:hypothetical protein